MPQELDDELVGLHSVVVGMAEGEKEGALLTFNAIVGDAVGNAATATRTAETGPR